MNYPQLVPAINAAYLKSVRRDIGASFQAWLWISTIFILPFALFAHLYVVAYVPQLLKYAMPVPQTIQDAVCAVFPRCNLEAPVLRQEGFKAQADLVQSGHTLLAIYLIASLAILLTSLPKMLQYWFACYNLVRIRKEQLRQKHASPELRERLTLFAGFGLGAHIFYVLGIFISLLFLSIMISNGYLRVYDLITGNEAGTAVRTLQEHSPATLLHYDSADIFMALGVNIMGAYIHILFCVGFLLRLIAYAMWRFKWAG